MLPCYSLFLVYVIITSSLLCSCFTEGCNFTLDVTQQWKRINSPAYPLPFSLQTVCYWRLVAPKNYRVKLQFTGFSLAPRNENGKCLWQWVSISNGEELPNVRSDEQKSCGHASPGTLVSTGSILRLSLISNKGASGHHYTGFQASFTQTEEGTTMPKRQTIKSKTKSTKPSGRETIGSALDRILPPRFKTNSGKKTQSETIEEINKRRNSGLAAEDNPIFLGNGEILSDTETKSTFPKTTTTRYSIPPRPKPKRKPTISNEAKTVLIVVAIIVIGFLLILVVNKSGFFQKISRWKEKKNINKDPLDESYKKDIKIKSGLAVENKTQATEKRPRENNFEASRCAESKTSNKNRHRHSHGRVKAVDNEPSGKSNTKTKVVGSHRRHHHKKHREETRPKQKVTTKCEKKQNESSEVILKPHNLESNHARHKNYSKFVNKNQASAKAVSKKRHYHKETYNKSRSDGSSNQTMAPRSRAPGGAKRRHTRSRHKPIPKKTKNNKYSSSSEYSND